jgi:glycosyltransferase involved in cell wall biosynthesis
LSQVIKKRRIVLASVLKPVDDTRMFEKLGVTLAESGDFDVTIIGYPSAVQPANSAIKFISLSRFKRFSLGRFIAPWSILRKINSVQADIVIINTPELLLVGVMSKLFNRHKLIYDVLENYYNNIKYTSAYPRGIRTVLAYWVRLTEVVTAPWVDLFLLAEKGYAHELNFAKPHIILQNKLPASLVSQFSRVETRGYSKLIFTGTLAPTTGVFEAIKLCQELYKIDSSFTLKIIGYSAQPEILNQIKKSISDHSFITLTGGDTIVPHTEILKAISTADVGLILYPINPSTQSSIPTKLYEYLAMKLPILIRHNPESHQLVQSIEAGLVLGEHPDYLSIVQLLKERHFLPNPTPDDYWEAHNFIANLKNV